jgi:hypothetical protein
MILRDRCVSNTCERVGCLTKKYGKLGEPRRVGIQEVEGGFMPAASIKSVGLKRSKSTS